MSRNWRELLRLRRLIARRLLLSRLSLGLERLTAALWAPVLVLGGFAAVALFDVLPLLPGLLHGLCLAAFAVGLLWLLRRGFIGFTWPTARQAKHHLETASGVNHRPLTAWEDNLGYKAGPGQNKLWMAHRLRMFGFIERLSSPRPGAVVAAMDQFAIRGLVLLLCVIGTLGAQGDIGPRFIRALNPALASDTGPVDVKVWITPPAYTSRPPILLDPMVEMISEGPIVVPDGTQVLTVVTGTTRATRLVVDGTSIDLAMMDDASQRYEGPLPTGVRLEVRQTSKVLATWDMAPLADLPPEIAVGEPPSETGRFRLGLKYTAEDDYGVIAVSGRIDRPEETRPYAKSWATDFSVSLPPLTPKEIEHRSFHDFTAHPWAGKDVTLRLTARDAAGQTGVSDIINFRLPERTFSHLVAATIIQYRKDLIDDPATAPMAARALSRLMEVPKAYGGDVIAHLAMASARSRLDLQDATDVLDSVINLMWQAALRMEDGAMAVAEQALNDAEQALSDAIENGASPEEIGRLIERLQRALVEYYQALMENMPDGSFPLTGQSGDMQTMGSEDLAQMMEQLRQLSEMGAEDAAKAMLSDLKNMLEQLRNTALSPMDNPDVEAARQMMEDLKNITEEQSNMLNKSFEQSRQRALERTPPNPRDRNSLDEMQSEEPQSNADQEQSSKSEQGEDAAMQQKQLRDRLGDLMSEMAEMTGQLPSELGEADQAMQDAESALRQESWRAASDAQAEALANLQSGMQGAAQQIMEALAEQGLAGLIPIPGQAGQPLGAMGPNLGPDDGEETELPTDPDTRGLSQRSREILEEIRRRSGQRLRSREERQYLRRLLEQF
ncbi:MAG: TIGR02302 family protein [Alphaproteobacteria bacterium]|nr:TIGR02302 family protein [Alphaproteobacteria bacterium]